MSFDTIGIIGYLSIKKGHAFYGMTFILRCA